MIGFLKSFQFAFQGIRFAWQGRNFRVQSAFAIAVIAFAFYLQLSREDWTAVLIIIGLVLAFEVMNTAIESLVNFVSPEHHALAGKIKDLAAGAVLILSIISVVIGCIVFLPYLY
jgi:diacylglycerol kinase